VDEDVGFVAENDGAFVSGASIQPAEVGAAIGRGIHGGQTEFAIRHGDSQSPVAQYAESGGIQSTNHIVRSRDVVVIPKDRERPVSGAEPLQQIQPTRPSARCSGTRSHRGERRDPAHAH